MISEKQRDRIKELREKNWSMMGISIEMGISIATVQLYCKKFDPNNSRSLTRKVSKDKQQEIVEFYLNCLDINKTVLFLDNLISKQSVRSILIKNKVYKPKINNNRTKSQHVIDWKKDKKIKLIEYKGGKCIKCGYNKCHKALEFHHLDPSQKNFSISSNSFSFEKMKIEADKCILLCANCHREYHDGMFEI